MTKICTVRVHDGEETGAERIFKETVPEKLQILMKDMNMNIQESR